MSEALKSQLGQPNDEVSLSRLPQRTVPKLPPPKDSSLKAFLGFISRRLDDMLSTPFGPHMINYEPPMGFLVPKFTMYDRTNDLFNHLMHFRQMMTLDIGNDVLLCKVFPTSLHGPNLFWFHWLS